VTKNIFGGSAPFRRRAKFFGIFSPSDLVGTVMAAIEKKFWALFQLFIL
jgi:hypothetical protein